MRVDNIKDDEDNIDKHYPEIPKYRTLNLYVILVCGLIIFFYGLYTKFFEKDKTPKIWFDGEDFHKGVIDGLYFIIIGLIICVFPVYHLIKKNHRVK